MMMSSPPLSKPNAHDKNRCFNPLVMSYIRDDWIRQQMQQRENEYMSNHTLSIFSGTWNVNGKKPMSSRQSNQLSNWLTVQDHDIIIVGFQEIVDLNAVNVVVNNLSQQRTTQWEETIRSSMKNNGTEYTTVIEKHMVGILLILLIKTKHIRYLHDVRADHAGVGVMGVMGNKGAVSVRMRLYSSTFCFICAHLAAHRDNVHGRNTDYSNILNKTEFHTNTTIDPRHQMINHSEQPVKRRILDHDYVIWIGDLNYRITEDVSIEHCFVRLEADDLQYLADHDQLTIERRRFNVFRGFEEGPLTFRPTYKFQPGTSLYERRPEKKTRAPAWCDRILWKARYPDDIVLKEYNSVDSLLLSDHKPVRAIFQAQVRYEVEKKKDIVTREIMHQLDKWENENMPKVKIEGSVINFSQVFFHRITTQTCCVENTGQVVAHFRFIPKLQDKNTCKRWCSVKPSFGMIPPHEKLEIQIKIHVDTESAQQLMSATDSLDDTLILRIENGRDYFVIISGTYQPSCFGSSLTQLVHQKSPIRELNQEALDEETEQPQKIPKELWRMVDDLYQSGIKERGLWTHVSTDDENIHELLEALDTGSSFPPHPPRAMAQLLLQFLQSIREPLVPEHLLSNCEADPMRIQLNGRAILNGLSPPHYNVFVYIVSFLREVLKHGNKNKSTAAELAYIFTPCFISPKVMQMASGKQDTMKRLLLHFFTTNAL